MDVESLLIGSILVVIGIALLAFGGRKLRTLLRLRADDPVPIGDAPYEENPVEVEGTVETAPGEEPFESPFVERDCVAYEYKIEEKRRSGGRNKSSSWRTIESSEESQPFVLSDDSGRAHVIPDGADLSLESERQRDSLFSEYLPGNVSVGGGFSLGGFSLGGGRKRYTEERLDVGEEAYIYGEASHNAADVDADVTLSLGEEVPKFLISDTSAAGTHRRYLLSGGGLALLGVLLTIVGAIAIFGAL
ncbi:E3 ubiquitin ligase family protein [Natranaeroarchaeum aerophilus]|uniref:RING-type E3 ubiquitin transferase n=1 Tax=Natranaeroarchaeum aerophilus TaxID=2917711 RepID=A0AAE3FPS4_9EURY|nr:E3 ubiquitin ligase family protein [Natranaeroarchaeum aerophilus]MCL9812870.1 E3 ubiquitin ligase family protein [Natranaeroarchaeum aerophilus]